MELIFATNNLHKIKEVNQILGKTTRLLCLDEAGLSGEIPETGDTLHANASQKAWWVYDRSGKNCFADDTGLEVEVLGGAPGVYSARYAGPQCSFDDNIRKLLVEMKGQSNRKARFRTVVCLILDGKEYFFEGRVDGSILEEKRGSGGFGYDPVFMPESGEMSFSELPDSEKNRISHRGRAVRKMLEFLNKIER